MDQTLIDFLKNRTPKYCALASSSPEGQPSCHIMAYAITDEGELLFNTAVHSRKYDNFRRNPFGAVTVGWEKGQGQMNIQIEGSVALLGDLDVSYPYLQDIFYGQNPELSFFRSLTDHGFLRLKPLWVRTTDFSSSPPAISEYDLAAPENV
jgi:uncharacterized pyridoxamine 5'-phosphate oxidase family protein